MPAAASPLSTRLLELGPTSSSGVATAPRAALHAERQVLLVEHTDSSCSACGATLQPQAKAAVAAPRELSLACCSGEATDMDPASASGRHMLDQPAAQAIASSKQPAADVECGDSLPQPIKGQVVSGGLYDDERRLTSWRHYACLGLVVSILIGLAVGMICVGVIPAQNYQASSDVAFKSAGVKRTYYLSVEEVNWTYTPGGKDKIWAPLYGTYLNHTAPESAILGNFIKGHYVAYTDDTFTVKKNISDAWKHLGILGPIMHAEAGDTLEVWLRNMLAAPVNLEPLGTAWNIQGALGPIDSGLTGRFLIDVPVNAGPAPDSDQNSHLFLYHSAVNPTRHENSGLVGGIVITRKGEANPDGTPQGVDREIVTVFQIFNELETEFNVNNGPFWEANGWDTTRYSINGRSWGTLEGLEMNVGERVRWYVGGLGTENAMHNFHWHGNVLQMDGHNVDQVTAIPATTLALDMYPDNPGEWLFHCHVNSHLTGGMANLFTVNGTAPAPTTGGIERTYYIAADEVVWDYAPLNGTACTTDGSVLPFDDVASTYLGPPEGMRLGSNVTKALFREYTDGTFTVLKNRTGNDAYLGFLAPLIRAQVGDTLRIVLRNNLPDHPVTLHPHGVLYNKSSEGAPYADGTGASEHADDAVLPGQEYTYIWEVPERAGPGKKDPSSIMWMYHSHSDETKDTWAGLMGGMIFTARDTPVRSDGTPTDIDEERVLFFATMDETMSLYAALNAEKYLGLNETQFEAALADDLTGGDFLEAWMHRSINGFMFCNMPRLQLPAGARARLHFMALGDIADMHTPSMGRGGGFINLGQREGAVQMSPGAMHSVDIVLTQKGTWQLSCNVMGHGTDGISAMYSVTLPANYTDPVLLASATVRTFYIQAEEQMWDYAPKGYQKCTIVDFTVRSQPYLVRTNVTIGSGMYRKAFYREYTDATFMQRVPQPPYQGVMGPLMVMEPGNLLRVILKNNLTEAINFSPGGGLVSLADDPTAGDSVEPGQTYTYEFLVPDQAGPTDIDLSSVAYGYHSTVQSWHQQQMGLLGLLVVARRGSLVNRVQPLGSQLQATLMPNDVDHLIPLLWMVFNENMSPWLTQDMAGAGLNVTAIEAANENQTNAAAFEESNLKHSINGFMYCNLPPPDIKKYSRARILFLSIGGTEGLHSPVVTKFPLIDAKGAHDSATLMPGYTATMDLIANYTSLFPMWCNVHDHLEAGMSGQYNIY